MLRRFLIIAAALVLVSAGPKRVRRQEDGCFWWLEDNNCADNTAAASEGGGTSEGVETTDVRTAVDTADRIANSPDADPVNQAYAHCSGGSGRCVPYYLCREGNIITDGAGLIDIRVGPNRGDNSTSVRTSNSECQQFLDVCCTSPEPPQPPPLPPKTEQRCGQRNELGVNTRILGFKDNQAQFGEFPWMAAILRKEFIDDKELNLYVCGGSLIHPLVVLTAAHCVQSKNAASLKVRLGEWDTQRTYELYPHIDRNVIHVTTHEGFNPGALWNDFALLFLETPADLTPNIGTVCLPQPGDVFDYEKCWATGWGRDEFGKEGNYQNVLKEIELPIVPKGECEAALRTTRLGAFFRLDQSFTCAGGQKGLDTCKGDGGSPLVCETGPLTNTYIQSGIVAWGIGCGENGVPGVYADVAYASNWITTKADEGILNLYTIAENEGHNPNYWRNY